MIYVESEEDYDLMIIGKDKEKIKEIFNNKVKKFNKDVCLHIHTEQMD